MRRASDPIFCADCGGWGREYDPDARGNTDGAIPCRTCGGTGNRSSDEIIAFLLDDARTFSPDAPWARDSETCDCGDGYPCGHGSWWNEIAIRNRHHTPENAWPNEFGISEVGDITDDDLALIVSAPLLLAEVRRLRAGAGDPEPAAVDEFDEPHKFVGWSTSEGGAP